MADSGNTRSTGSQRTEPKNFVIPIITAVIASILGGSAVINLLISAFYTPNIAIEIGLDKKNEHTATINVINKGNAPAKHVILTVETPATISFYRIFSTENYTENDKIGSKELQIYIPRFVHGEGSMVRIDTRVDLNSNITLGKYTAYSTYDQGSSKAIASVIEKPLTFADYVTQFSNALTSTYSFNIVMILLAIIIPVIIRWIRIRAKKKKKSDW